MARIPLGPCVSVLLGCQLAFAAQQVQQTRRALNEKALAQTQVGKSEATTTAPQAVLRPDIADPRVRSAQFQRSQAQISDAQDRTEMLLGQLTALRNKNPEAAGKLDPSIQRLQQILEHLRSLNRNATTMRSGKMNSGMIFKAPPPSTSDVTLIASWNEQAQTELIEADSIARSATEQAGMGTGTASNGSSAEPPNPAPTPPSTAPSSPPDEKTGADTGQPATGSTGSSGSGASGSSGADEAESAWFARLRPGVLQYSVSKDMKWKVPSTVTVVINGALAPPPQRLDGQTAQASIPVSHRMKVLVSCGVSDPDEFTIAAQPGTQEVQFVPENGITTWNFTVTPRFTGSDHHLRVQAWVLYSADTQRELPVYDAAVTVHVPSVGESLKRLIEGDPDYWLKYGMPGGAGFIFFSGVVAGIWKLRKKKTAATPPTASTVG